MYQCLKSSAGRK